MDYIEEYLEKFENLPQELQDYLNSEESIKTLEEIEESFGVDLTLALILVFVDELDLEDLPIYIKEKYKTDTITTNQIIFKLEEGIFRNLIKNFQSQEDFEPEKDYLLDLDFSEKKTLIFSIFSEKIIEQLQISEGHLFRLNMLIFEIISEEEAFFDRISRAFLDNKEKISNNYIVTQGKTLDPTISNWIKDYIASQGSDMMTAVSLAKYLSTSENVKNLSQEDRQILRQVLKIYKNLIFFPESMGNAPYKDWEIFPINRDILSFYINQRREVGGSLTTPSEPSKFTEPDDFSAEDTGDEMIDIDEQKLDDSEDRLSDDVGVSATQEEDEIIDESYDDEEGVIEEELEEDLPVFTEDDYAENDDKRENTELIQLKKMLEEYPQNSLERKAVEAEIKRLEKK